MVTDFIVAYLRKDPTVKRDLLKTVSWRLIGSIDTALLAFIITGKLKIGLAIGAMELLTKMVLYFLHERVWHRIPYGLPYSMRLKRRMPAEKGQLFTQSFAITKTKREKRNGHPAFTIWLTGLSGSGKSSIASELDVWLHTNHFQSYVIDGDNTRLGINRDLDFSKDGRDENIRRVAEICKLMNDAGMIVISSFISPYAEGRHQAAQIIGENNFTEIFIDASLETCIQRDTKGLYKLAAEGKIKDFTGVNSPYEKPQNPSLTLSTDLAPVEESVALLVNWIKKNKLTTLYAKPATAQESVLQ